MQLTDLRSGAAQSSQLHAISGSLGISLLSMWFLEGKVDVVATSGTGAFSYHIDFV